MIITPYKTKPVTKGAVLTDILDTYLPALKENDIVIITSKIVSICQGRMTKFASEEEKLELVKKECQFYIENDATRKYHMLLTIANNILIPNGGLDESNGDGYLILWPKDPMTEAARVWEYLRNKYHLTHLGVIITDSHTTPLRWGTNGLGLAWCGFDSLNTYIGKPDIFGRPLQVTKANILDGIAAGVVVTMGEGNECMPLAVASDMPFVHFTEAPPSTEEIENLKITIDDDLYSPVLTSSPWEKGQTA